MKQKIGSIKVVGGLYKQCAGRKIRKIEELKHESLNEIKKLIYVVTAFILIKTPREN